MNKVALSLILASFLTTLAPTCFADDRDDRIYDEQNRNKRSYIAKTSTKALHGLLNLATAPLEIPKNIVNTTNDSNLIYGLTAGFFKGVLNMFGRTGVGFLDLTTAALPTKEIVYPAIIWDDWDADTQYGKILRRN
ncbi:MAG: exosortase system-associated protein, TIGR04073 family [Methylococcales bacterium]|nr:exosortase system-associated protein, TIGR04073 family [Methylococcales bacterium]